MGEGAKCSRKEWVALGAIVALALVLRLAHLHALHGDVLFDHPVLDEDRYVGDARAFADGAPFEARAFWQPPGIMYALSGIFLLVSDDLAAPRVVQAVLGAATCALAFELARRLFSVRVGLATAAIVATHGVLIFSGGELLPATWACALDVGALVLLLDAPEDPFRALSAGLALGVSAVFAPVVLPFALVAAAWLVVSTKPERRASVIAWFAAGLVAPIVPVTIRNWAVSHELVLVSTNGGANFYIGNNPRSFDTFAIRPGVHWSELLTLPARAGVTRAGEQSRWFTSQGLAFWRDHPVHALGNYAHKIGLFFSGAEIPRDADVYDARGSSWVLRALVGPRPVWWPDGLLVPLACVGLLAHARRRGPVRLALAFVVAQALTIALFFVTSRYRVPVLPVLAMFAVAGALEIARATSKRRAALGCTALVLGVALNVPTREAMLAYPAEPELYRGLAYERALHDRGAAIEHFRRGTELDPRDARPWFELGNALAADHRIDEAVDAWDHADACDPSDPRARHSAELARRP